MKTIVATLIILALGSLLLMRASAKDKVQNALASCIQKEARAAQYAGNVYGPEAWELFAPLCNNI